MVAEHGSDFAFAQELPWDGVTPIDDVIGSVTYNGVPLENSGGTWPGTGQYRVYQGGFPPTDRIASTLEVPIPAAAIVVEGRAQAAFGINQVEVRYWVENSEGSGAPTLIELPHVCSHQIAGAYVTDATQFPGYSVAVSEYNLGDQAGSLAGRMRAAANDEPELRQTWSDISAHPVSTADHVWRMDIERGELQGPEAVVGIDAGAGVMRLIWSFSSIDSGLLDMRGQGDRYWGFKVEGLEFGRDLAIGPPGAGTRPSPRAPFANVVDPDVFLCNDTYIVDLEYYGGGGTDCALYVPSGLDADMERALEHRLAEVARQRSIPILDRIISIIRPAVWDGAEYFDVPSLASVIDGTPPIYVTTGFGGLTPRLIARGPEREALVASYFGMVDVALPRVSVRAISPNGPALESAAGSDDRVVAFTAGFSRTSVDLAMLNAIYEEIWSRGQFGMNDVAGSTLQVGLGWPVIPPPLDELEFSFALELSPNVIAGAPGILSPRTGLARLQTASLRVTVADPTATILTSPLTFGVGYGASYRIETSSYGGDVGVLAVPLAERSYISVSDWAGLFELHESLSSASGTVFESESTEFVLDALRDLAVEILRDVSQGGLYAMLDSVDLPVNASRGHTQVSSVEYALEDSSHTPDKLQFDMSISFSSVAARP